MISVQGEDGIERMHQHRIRLVLLARRAEHHVHEIGGVTELIARVHERFAHRILVGQRDDGRQLGDDAVEADVALYGVGEVFVIVVEGRQGADHADHHRHRVRVTAEALVELGHLLVNHGVTLDDIDKFHLLLHVRQIAVLQQVSDI